MLAAALLVGAMLVRMYLSLADMTSTGNKKIITRRGLTESGRGDSGDERNTGDVAEGVQTDRG